MRTEPLTPMNLRHLALLSAALLVASCGQPEAPGPVGVDLVAFGSGSHQDLPQPVWRAVLDASPDLFLFLGDNVIGDTRDMAVLRSRYGQLASQGSFQRLVDQIPVMATWDDHDMGERGADRTYPLRDSSQAVFMDFWSVPDADAMRSRPGVYSSRILGPPGRRVQVILLDTRYFRDPLSQNPGQSPAERDLGFGPYVPLEDASATMLGADQWAWLEARLYEPAEVRIIGSSVQVIGGDHGWESWAQMPHERQRLYDLIRQTGAQGVVFVSGGMHWAEFSADTHGPYTMYDATSSALNQQWLEALNLPNRHRVSEAVYPYPNFGLIRIDWASGVLTLEIRDELGAIVFGHGIRLSTLR